jgi:hypothetical protein
MPPTKHPHKPWTKSIKQQNDTHKHNNQSNNKTRTSSKHQSLITQFIETNHISKNSKQQDPIPRQESKEILQLNNRNKNTPETQKQKRFTQIKIPNYNIGNDTFGDDIQSEQDEIFYFHNINGIKSDDNWAQILHTLQEHNVTCFGLAETNVSFAHATAKDYLRKLRQMFKHSRHTTSERLLKSTQYKTGGTLTAVVGKWQARVTEQGDDKRGLGRWSFLRLSSKKQNLVIITAYRPIPANGLNTNWMQQWTLLREQGVKEPDPIKEFYKDLTEQLIKWQHQGYEIILMIDANEVIGSKPGGLTDIAIQLNMADLIALHHGIKNEPNTHIRGSKRIDYILGTQRVQDCCTHSGILPFYNGYASDHRPIYASINLPQLMSDKNVTNLESQAARLISKSTPRERLQAIHLVDDHYQAQNLYKRMETLDQLNTNEWQPEHQDEYNDCDAQHIVGLLAAEHKACRPKPYPWSPTF